MSAKYKSPSFLLPNELNTDTNPSLSADRASNYSMDFDGSSYINIDSSSFGSNSFSISLWFKQDTGTGFQGLFAGSGYSGGTGFIIYTHQNEVKIYTAVSGSTTVILTSSTFSFDTWYHVTLKREYNVGWSLYIDGTEVDTYSSLTTTDLTSANTRIGKHYTSGLYFNGQIDEVAIFNKALTSSNITSLYNSGSPASAATTINLGAIAYYPLGEQAQMQGYLGNEASSEWQFPNGVLQDYVMDFNGNTGYINAGTEVGDSLGSSVADITVSLWYKNQAGSNVGLFSIMNSITADSTDPFAISYNNNGIYVWFGATYRKYSQTLDSNWHHLAIFKNGTSLTVYIDGSNISPSTSVGSIPATINTVNKETFIGLYYNASFTYDGELSNVAIWNTDQSTNIANIYNNGSPQTTYTVTPQNWWKLNADSVYTPSAPNYTTAVDFNAPNIENLSLSTMSTLATATEVTFSIWAKITKTPIGGNNINWLYGDSSGSIVGKNSAGGNFKYEISLKGTSDQLRSDPLPYAIFETWHHVVVTLGTVDAKLYLNGELKDTHAVGTNGNLGVNAFLGTYPSSPAAVYALGGFLSNFSIFNSVLSESQISTLFNFGTPETTPSFSPIHYWKLNDINTGLNDIGSLASNNATRGATTGSGPTTGSTSVAVVPSWKIPTELPIPSVNYTKSLDFDPSGSGDYISFGNRSAFKPTSNYTFSIWFNGDDFAYRNIIGTNSDVNSANGGVAALFVNSTKITWYHRTSTASPSFNLSMTYSAGAWYNLIVTWSASTGDVKGYINGKYINKMVGVNNIEWGNELEVGRYFGGLYDFDGKLSNFAMWNTTLTDGFSGTPSYEDVAGGQVAEVYNNGQPQASITGSPVGWWKLDDQNTITDYSGNNYTGTNNGAVDATGDVTTSDFNIPVNAVSTTLPSTALQQSDLQFDSPYSNYSLYFDGTGDYINCGNNVGLSGISSMAFSNWVKYDNPAQANTWRVSMGNSYWNTYGFSTGIARTGIVPSGGVQPFFTLLSSSGTTNKIGGQNSTSNATSLNPLLANTWYHVAGTWDGTTMKLFINGVIYDYKTFSSSWTLDSTTATFFIGSGATGSSSAYPMLGNIDEAALWLNKTLTDAEILQIYNNGKPNDISSFSPTNWWRLGENAYFDNNSFIVPNSITGAPNGTGFGTVTSMLAADAPGTYANGVGTNLDIVDRVGDAPLSTANSQSYNMIPDDKVPYVPGYVGLQTTNNSEMSFDGINDYIETAFNLPSNTTSFSVSMWVNTTSFSTAQILIDNRDSAFDGYNCFISSNTINFRINGTDTSVSTSGLSVNNWFHLALTYDGSTAKIYLNSGTPTEQALTTTLNINNVTRIGAISQSTASTFFSGKIDEVAIFDKALTADQVKFDLYNATTTGKTADIANNPNLPNPVAWYRMGD